MNDSDKELGEILSEYAWSSDSEMGDHDYSKDDAITDIKAWVRGKLPEKMIFHKLETKEDTMFIGGYNTCRDEMKARFE